MDSWTIYMKIACHVNVFLQENFYKWFTQFLLEFHEAQMCRSVRETRLIIIGLSFYHLGLNNVWKCKFRNNLIAFLKHASLLCSFRLHVKMEDFWKCRNALRFGSVESIITSPQAQMTRGSLYCMCKWESRGTNFVSTNIVTDRRLTTVIVELLNWFYRLV